MEITTSTWVFFLLIGVFFVLLFGERKNAVDNKDDSEEKDNNKNG